MKGPKMRKYIRRADYKKLRLVVEDHVSKRKVVLADKMLEELATCGFDLTVQQLAFIVRRSRTVMKLYERKQCAGAPTGYFIWLVDRDTWLAMTQEGVK